VRNAAGQPASIGTVIVMNEMNYVVAWWAVNSTSPRHIAVPIREMIRRSEASVRLYSQFDYDYSSLLTCVWLIAMPVFTQLVKNDNVVLRQTGILVVHSAAQNMHASLVTTCCC
jgi:hypothetical protein